MVATVDDRTASSRNVYYERIFPEVLVCKIMQTFGNSHISKVKQASGNWTGHLGPSENSATPKNGHISIAPPFQKEGQSLSQAEARHSASGTL